MRASVALFLAGFRLLVALTAEPSCTAAAEQKLPACPLGKYQFVVKGTPFAQDVKAERIVVNDHSVSIGDACPSVPATVQAGPGGISIRARWDSCVGIAGPVELDGFVHSVACVRLTGTLRRSKAKTRDFTALMPQCDDDPPPEDEFNKAAEFADSQVHNLWGNPDDFFRAMLLTQSQLGCALAEKDLRPPRNSHQSD